MNTTANVILFAQSTNKGYPLKIRITTNRVHTFIGLKYYLTDSQKKKYWNDTKKVLIKSYPFYDEVMKEFNLVKKKLGIESINNEIVVLDAPVNTSSFTQYYKNYMKSLEIQSQIGLLHKTTSVLYQLELFLKESGRPSDIKFSDLNIDFINDFKHHLVKKKILPVSQRGYLEKIRGIINKAIKEDKYNPKRHPFLGFEFMKIVTEPKHLKKDEFRYLQSSIEGRNVMVNPATGEQNKLVLTPESLNAGRMWLFQYYAFGMRVSDLLLLRWSNIYESGKRLKYQMYKTKQSMDFVLNNELLDLLYRYFDQETRISIIKGCHQASGQQSFKLKDGTVLKYDKKVEWYDLIRSKLYYLSSHPDTMNNRIFSKIPSDLEIDKDVKVILSKISTYTSVYNGQLKDLSKELQKGSGKDLKLSSHMARHTFAYLAILDHQSIYYISQALNHKSIKTTENYLKGFDNRGLDNMFYSAEISAADKKSIDDGLKELLASSDYEKKKKILDLFNM